MFRHGLGKDWRIPSPPFGQRRPPRNRRAGDSTGDSIGKESSTGPSSAGAAGSLAPSFRFWRRQNQRSPFLYGPFLRCWQGRFRPAIPQNCHLRAFRRHGQGRAQNGAGAFPLWQGRGAGFIRPYRLGTGYSGDKPLGGPRRGQKQDAYVHRAGRTGRASNRDTMVCISDELDMCWLSTLEKKLGIAVYPKELHSGRVYAPCPSTRRPKLKPRRSAA